MAVPSPAACSMAGCLPHSWIASRVHLRYSSRLHVMESRELKELLLDAANLNYQHPGTAAAGRCSPAPPQAPEPASQPSQTAPYQPAEMEAWMLEHTPQEPCQEETRLKFSWHKCLLSSKKMGPWPNLSKGECRACRGKHKPTASVPGPIPVRPHAKWRPCSCLGAPVPLQSLSSQPAPAEGMLHQLQAQGAVPPLSPLPLLLFGVFQLWKNLLQCFEIWLEIRKGLGLCYCRGVKQHGWLPTSSPSKSLKHSTSMQ